MEALFPFLSGKENPTPRIVASVRHPSVTFVPYLKRTIFQMAVLLPGQAWNILRRATGQGRPPCPVRSPSSGRESYCLLVRPSVTFLPYLTRGQNFQGRHGTYCIEPLAKGAHLTLSGDSKRQEGKMEDEYF